MCHILVAQKLLVSKSFNRLEKGLAVRRMFTDRIHDGRVEAFHVLLRRVGRSGWDERPEANDQLAPAPHRTERTDFPYSALRTHSSGRFPRRSRRQTIEAVVVMQPLVGVAGP